MARLFLSHSSQDNAAAIALGRWLSELGIDDLFLDIDSNRGLAPGERWQEALKAAADRCEAVLFLVSDAWLASRWCLAEFLLAKTLHKRIFGLTIEPIAIEKLPVEMTGEWQLCDLAALGARRSFEVELSTGIAVVVFAEAGLNSLHRGLARAGLDGRTFLWPPRDEPQRAPYRGLRALEFQDAAIFFGRDVEIVRALDRIRGLVEGGVGGFLVVLGASGAGKSSFLRAGLLPRLARDDVVYLSLPVVRPETAAITGASGLAASITSAFAQQGATQNLGDVRRRLLNEANGLPSLLEELLALVRRRFASSHVGSADPTLILSVDQAEELFAPEGAAEAEWFLKLLARELAPASAASRRILLIATIRSDRYQELQGASAITGIRQEPFNLPPLPASELKSVIEGPAERATGAGRTLAISPALTARLIKEARGADALPLLGFTLEQLYKDFGAGRTLTEAHYDAVGGVHGIIEAAVAVALSAPDRIPTISAKRSEQMALLRSAFIPWLARVDPQSRSPQRRVATLAEMSPAAHPIVARLIEARLLAADHREGCDVVEVAHESLLRNWPELTAWLEEDAADLAILDGVERAASEWNQNDRLDIWLDHRSARLEEARRVLARQDFERNLDDLRARYLEACAKREEVTQAERRAVSRRLLRRTQFGLAASLTLTIVAGIGAWFGFAGQIASQRQFEVAEGRRAQVLAFALKAETNPNVVEAVALSVLQNGLATPTHVGERNQLLDRVLIAANGNRQRMVIDHSELVSSVAFSPDGNRIATGSIDGKARIWSALNGSLLAVLSGHKGGVFGVAFSPDGRHLVTASHDKTARVWDVVNGNLLFSLTGHTDTLDCAAFSADGGRIVTGSADQSARIWNANNGLLLKTFSLNKGRIFRVEFDHTGTKILTAIGDSTARIWDAQSGTLLTTFAGHKGAVYAASFSPDDQTIITASADKTARIWDVASAASLRILGGHTDSLEGAAFSPDGATVATSSVDKTVRIWDVATGAVLGVLSGHESTVASVTF